MARKKLPKFKIRKNRAGGKPKKMKGYKWKPVGKSRMRVY